MNQNMLLVVRTYEYIHFSYFKILTKQTRNPGTVEKRIANSDGRTDQWTEGGFNM